MATGDEVAITALPRVRVDPRRVAYGAIDEALGELGLPVADTEIPDRADFHHSAIVRAPLVLLRPAGAGALAYRRLARELDERSPRREEALVRG